MEEYGERIARIEERSKSNSHRLDKLEPVVEDIHNMSEAIVELTTEMKHTNENVRSIKDKVELLEQEPAKRWKDSTKAIFNAFLGALGTAVAGGLLYLLTMIQ